jgi:hypothetical protein
VGSPLVLAVTGAALERELGVIPLGHRVGMTGDAAEIGGAGEGRVATLALALDGGMGAGERSVHERPLSPEKQEQEREEEDDPRTAEYPVALNRFPPFEF